MSLRIYQNENPLYGYIYRITNTLNNKVYIGQTVNPNRRFGQHFSDAKRGSKTLIAKAMRKYPIEAFKYEIIACCTSKEDLHQTEIDVIAQYGSNAGGYNIHAGGVGHKQTEECKRLISEKNTGKKASPETRAKMSKAARGKPKSKSHNRNVALSKTRAWVVTDPNNLSYLVVGGLKEFCKRIGFGEKLAYRGLRNDGVVTRFGKDTGWRIKRLK